MESKWKISGDVSLSRGEALREASRCLFCEQPMCVQKCPAGVDVPSFLREIINGGMSKALHTIKKANNIPFACSRLCPAERMCELGCSSVLSKPIQIAKLERYASSNGNVSLPSIKKKQKKVAIVGSGPCGMSCAEDLALLGYDVTIFEALHIPGGVLRWGIPYFRMPHNLVDNYAKHLSSLGVKIVTNFIVGRLVTIPELKRRFSAVFIATGSSLPAYMNIEGEHLQNIITANEFLYRINVVEQHLLEPKNDIFTPRKVVVVGGNDSAVDAARLAGRLGSMVSLVYYRSMEDMAATSSNIQNARKEGIKFLSLSLPKRYIGSTKVESVEIIQMRMEEDEIGNKVPVEIEGSEYTEEADLVIIALGATASPIVVNQANINHNLRGNILVDENLMTSAEGIFSGGAVTGAATVIEAVALGKHAAHSIDSYLTAKKEVEVEND